MKIVTPASTSSARTIFFKLNRLFPVIQASENVAGIEKTTFSLCKISFIDGYLASKKCFTKTATLTLRKKFRILKHYSSLNKKKKRLSLFLILVDLCFFADVTIFCQEREINNDFLG